jgi:DNA mismatch endonuclease (patch repair protein)
MSRIRSKNTSVEIAVFKELRKRKIYFQRHYVLASGCPDVAIPSKKLAVFIDGDFWHGYRYNKHYSRLPKKYWRTKIENNIRRDKKNRSMLRRAGWRVMRVWEHEINKDTKKTIEKMIKFISIGSTKA